MSEKPTVGQIVWVAMILSHDYDGSDEFRGLLTDEAAGLRWLNKMRDERIRTSAEVRRVARVQTEQWPDPSEIKPSDGGGWSFRLRPDVDTADEYTVFPEKVVDDLDVGRPDA